MHCFFHQDIEAVALCTQCGRGLCPECIREENNEIFCREGPCLSKRKDKQRYHGILGLLAQALGLVFFTLGILIIFFVRNAAQSLFSCFSGIVLFFYGVYLEKQSKL